MIKGAVEKRFHNIHHRQRHTAQIAAPFQLAHKPAADRVEIGHQIAGYQIQRQTLIEAFAVGVALQIDPFAEMLVEP